MENAEEKKERTSPAQFIREVRQEINKVSWPTRRETTISSAMVLLMAFLAAVFFFVVDFSIHHIVKFILGFGG